MTKLAIFTMIWCTFLFLLSCVGRRASKQNTHKDTRRFMKPAGILTLILILISIYTAHLKIKFGHKLTKMMEPENEQMNAYMSSRKLEGNLPGDFNSRVIDMTNSNVSGHKNVRNGKKTDSVGLSKKI